MVMVIGFCFFSIIAFGFFPGPILRAVTEDIEVLKLGISLLFIVALFQIVDAFQVSMSGILRGLGETKFPSLMVFLGYWIIGLPLGIYLTFFLDQGASGLWIGLAVSLTIVAISLGIFTNKKMKSLV